MNGPEERYRKHALSVATLALLMAPLASARATPPPGDSNLNDPAIQRKDVGDAEARDIGRLLAPDIVKNAMAPSFMDQLLTGGLTPPRGEATPPWHDQLVAVSLLESVVELSRKRGKLSRQSLEALLLAAHYGKPAFLRAVLDVCQKDVKRSLHLMAQLAPRKAGKLPDEAVNLAALLAAHPLYRKLLRARVAGLDHWVQGLPPYLARKAVLEMAAALTSLDVNADDRWTLVRAILTARYKAALERGRPAERTYRQLATELTLMLQLVWRRGLNKNSKPAKIYRKPAFKKVSFVMPPPGTTIVDVVDERWGNVRKTGVGSLGPHTVGGIELVQRRLRPLKRPGTPSSQRPLIERRSLEKVAR